MDVVEQGDAAQPILLSGKKVRSLENCSDIFEGRKFKLRINGAGPVQQRIADIAGGEGREQPVLLGRDGKPLEVGAVDDAHHLLAAAIDLIPTTSASRLAAI